MALESIIQWLGGLFSLSILGILLFGVWRAVAGLLQTRPRIHSSFTKGVSCLTLLHLLSLT